MSAKRSFQLVLKQVGSDKRVSVNVVQEAFVPVYTFGGGNSNYEVPFGGGVVTVGLVSTRTTLAGGSTNVGYSSKVSGAGAGYVSVSGDKITVKANDGFVAREAVVTFTQESSGKQVVVRVTLAKKPDEAILNVTPQSLSFGAVGGSKKVAVTSKFNGADKEWEVEGGAASLPSWVKVDKLTGGDGAKVNVMVSGNE